MGQMNSRNELKLVFAWYQEQIQQTKTDVLDAENKAGTDGCLLYLQ